MTRYGYEELTQAVRLNDAMSDAQGLPALVGEQGLDEGALLHVVQQRTMMLEKVIRKRGGGTIANKAALGSAWMDGFFAALHMIEQSTQKETQ